MANVIHGKLRALRNKVLVRNIDQGMRKSKGGIILTQSDAVSDGAAGIRPRWAEVYSVGSNIDWVKEGQWVLMEHGRWTMPVKLNDGEYVFHAGTLEKNKRLYAVGGRVLNFVVTSDNFSNSKNRILLNLEKLNWQGGFYRKDIGYKVID